MISERRVLILFEGKTDRKCLDSLRCLGTFNSLLLQGQYTPVQLNTSIYELYDPLIQSGEYDSLPVYLCHKGLLKCPENVRPQDMFALIYLIFDFDPLYHLYNPEKIRGLQRYFSDETKNGLLYINYPMVESLFDAEGKDGEFFITPTRPLSLCSSLAYKSTIKKQTPFRSNSGHALHILPPEDFVIVARASLARYREILESADAKWTLTDISALLESEIKATEDKIIYPLSCFPFMALDYNAEEALEEWNSLVESPRGTAR